MILIIAAMPEELEALKSLGSNVSEDTYQDIKLVKMTLGNHDVMLSQSGVGKINAAYTTSILAHHFKPELIINIGTAGGLKANQKVGDVVIADVVQSHDLDIGPDTHKDPRFIYYGNQKYNDVLEVLISKLGHTCYRGQIVSGDQFVVFNSYSYKRIQELYPEAICVEMEATAVGSAATRLNIPFVVIRSISDVPLNKGNEVEFETFLKLASDNSAKLTKAFLENI